MKALRRPDQTTLVVIGVAIVVYANTLGHGFVLDDAIVLVRNTYVQSGITGLSEIFTADTFSGFERMDGQANTLTGGRYRPLSLALFAVLGAVAGFSPVVFHSLAVIVYALLCGLIYRWLREILQGEAHADRIAWATALLFAVHPVHTEVVANVKSLDESLAMLLGTGALILVWQARSGGRPWLSISAGALAFLACLAKETAFMLVLLAPLSLWFFARMKTGGILRVSNPVWIGALLYLGIRQAALDQPAGAGVPDPLNDPFLVWSGAGWTEVPTVQRLATIFHVMSHYLRLTIWPAGLTHDYYPFHILIQNFSSWTAWTGLLLTGAIGAVAAGLSGRRHPASFGLIWFLAGLLPTSNLIFSVGTFMAERFLFFPSLGAMLTLASMWAWIAGRTSLRYLFGIGMTAILLFAGIATIDRNRAWVSNESLLRSAESVSAESAKWRNDMGTLLLDSALVMPAGDLRKATLDTALGHLVHATKLHPTYYDAWLARGACAYYAGDYAQSVEAYRAVSTLYPGDLKAMTGWLYALRGHGADLARQGQHKEALPVLRQAWSIQPDTASGTLLWRIYTREGPPDSAEVWLDRTIRLAPGDPRLSQLRQTAPATR